MRTRTALAASLALVAAAGSLSPALAGKKPKPITKEYTATAPLMSPTNAGQTVCAAAVPQSAYDEVFKAPFAGRLSAKQDGFVGDWDFAFQQDGANSAESAQAVTDDPQRPEEITGYKLKKGEEITIRSCNFSGGPTAHVKYTFTAL
jgi:hypothetical protein